MQFFQTGMHSVLEEVKVPHHESIRAIYASISQHEYFPACIIVTDSGTSLVAHK